MHTISNLAGTWPDYFVFQGVDLFTYAQCVDSGGILHRKTRVCAAPANGWCACDPILPGDQLTIYARTRPRAHTASRLADTVPSPWMAFTSCPWPVVPWASSCLSRTWTGQPSALNRPTTRRGAYRPQHPLRKRVYKNSWHAGCGPQKRRVRTHPRPSVSDRTSCYMHRGSKMLLLKSRRWDPASTENLVHSPPLRIP